MKQCERTWQAEALEDGRLDEVDRASFERHAAGCEACSRELAGLRALRALSQKILAVEPPPPDELSRRRLRGEILRRANEQAATRPPRRAWALVAAAACAAGLAFAWPRKAPSHFEVVDVTRAVWHTETVGATSRVSLDAGTALFQVQKLRPEARFLVRLPDGEIEVRGTRFVVNVEDGRTRSVVVTEGTVALRLDGTERILHAGDRWPSGALAPASAALPGPSAPAPSWATSASASVSIPLPSAPDASVLPAASLPAPPATSLPAPSVAALSPSPEPPAPHDRPVPPAPRASASQAPAVAPSASAPIPSASARFAEAMTAFSAGDYGRADELLAAFIRDFPRDGRAEDASFLRIESHARRGDRAGAAALARQYMQRFPRGLRRPEVERFIGGP